jgi:hypothetical protein
MSSSQYPQPPPTYQPAAAPYKDVPETSDPASPLLGSARAAGPSRAGGIYDMPEPGDIPDDFKVCCTFLVCCSMLTFLIVRHDGVRLCARDPTGIRAQGLHHSL